MVIQQFGQFVAQLIRNIHCQSKLTEVEMSRIFSRYSLEVWIRSVVISAILFTLSQFSLMSKVLGPHEKSKIHAQVVKHVKRDYYEEFQRAK